MRRRKSRGQNLPPSTGLQFFGHVAIDDASEQNNRHAARCGGQRTRGQRHSIRSGHSNSPVEASRRAWRGNSPTAIRRHQNYARLSLSGSDHKPPSEVRHGRPRDKLPPAPDHLPKRTDARSARMLETRAAPTYSAATECEHPVNPIRAFRYNSGTLSVMCLFCSLFWMDGIRGCAPKSLMR